MQSLTTVKHTCKFVSKESFNIKAYIWPHIKFCVQAWNPYYAKDIDLLERSNIVLSNLSPNYVTIPYEHTTAVTKKANRLLSIIHEVFFDKATFINLSKTYIQPVLEYGNIIWGPLAICLRPAISGKGAEKNYQNST